MTLRNFHQQVIEIRLDIRDIFWRQVEIRKPRNLPLQVQIFLRRIDIVFFQIPRRFEILIHLHDGITGTDNTAGKNFQVSAGQHDLLAQRRPAFRMVIRHGKGAQKIRSFQAHATLITGAIIQIGNNVLQTYRKGQPQNFILSQTDNLFLGQLYAGIAVVFLTRTQRGIHKCQWCFGRNFRDRVINLRLHQRLLVFFGMY